MPRTSAARLPLVAAPEPGVDAARFRATLGLIVSSLTSVSLRPPLVAFNPSRDSFTWSRMRRTGRFGVNVLGESHDAYVRAAAPAGADRFGAVTWSRTPSGLPRLAGAIAFLECEIDAEHRAGDHSIVVGRVLHAETAAGLPLLNWAGAFGRLAPGHDTETR